MHGLAHPSHPHPHPQPQPQQIRWKDKNSAQALNQSIQSTNLAAAFRLGWWWCHWALPPGYVVSESQPYVSVLGLAGMIVGHDVEDAGAFRSDQLHVSGDDKGSSFPGCVGRLPILRQGSLEILDDIADI